MIPFHDLLLAETAAARAAFLAIPTLRRGAAGELPLETYIAFLGEAYHHVSQTVPLLMACGSRLPRRLAWMQPAVAHYIEEEVGHERWILDDLAACGADPEAVSAGSPAPATELMVAYAWDTVMRGDPVGLFGMVLVLEGTSVALATAAASRIQARLGLPDGAFRYLASHGHLDGAHMDDYRRLVNRLDDARDRAAIVHRARMFYRLYGDIFATLPVPAAPATNDPTLMKEEPADA